MSSDEENTTKRGRYIAKPKLTLPDNPVFTPRKTLPRSPTSTPTSGTSTSTSSSTITEHQDKDRTMFSLNDALDKVSEFFDSVTEEDLSEYRYQGFDPILMRGIIATCEPDLPTFSKDIGTLISIYLMRGTNLDKIILKTCEAGAKRISFLKTKYKLVSSGVKLGRNTVSLARLAACFPEQTVKGAQQLTGQIGCVNTENLPEGYPKCMRTPVFASVIPHSLGNYTALLLDAHLVYLKKMDEVINKGNPTDVKTIKTYQEAAFNSPILDEDRRLRVLEMLGFIVLEEDPITGSQKAKSTQIPNALLERFIGKEKRKRTTDEAPEIQPKKKSGGSK